MRLFPCSVSRVGVPCVAIVGSLLPLLLLVAAGGCAAPHMMVGAKPATSPPVTMSGVLSSLRDASGAVQGWTFQRDQGNVAMPVDVSSVEGDARAADGKHVVLTVHTKISGHGGDAARAEQMILYVNRISYPPG